MKNTIHKKQGFTLIELLMVIAIIGILAGILIPAVGMVKERATIATSKARISQYLSAIQSFKGEYGYYPFASELNQRGTLDLSNTGDSEIFYETLTARSIDNPSKNVQVGGNRRGIRFYEFSSEELADSSSIVTKDTIIDGFGNNKIFIVFDHDNDGEVEVPDPEGSVNSKKKILTSLTAYVLADDRVGAPAYYLYE